MISSDAYPLSFNWAMVTISETAGCRQPTISHQVFACGDVTGLTLPLRSDVTLPADANGDQAAGPVTALPWAAVDQAGYHMT